MTNRHITRVNFKSKRDRRRAAEKYRKSDGYHWVRRIAKSMIQSPQVQRYLEKTKLPI